LSERSPDSAGCLRPCCAPPAADYQPEEPEARQRHGDRFRHFHGAGGGDRRLSTVSHAASPTGMAAAGTVQAKLRTARKTVDQLTFIRLTREPLIVMRVVS